MLMPTLFRLSPLAWRNLVHDRMRLAVTLTGVVFAVVLVVVQLGLFLGFTTATSGLIDHSGADLWVTAARVPYLEQGVAFSDRKLTTVLATPGVQAASTYLARFAQWQRPDGEQQSVQVVGFDPDAPLGGPWNIVAGRVSDLKAADNVFIDEIYRDRLGITHLGQVVELAGRRARVVGYTRGIRSFTTSPYVFTSFRNARLYAGLRPDQTVFILVTAASGVAPAALQQRLRATLRDADVHTAAEFSQMTQHYWMFTTGAGIAVLIAAVLGFVVGVVVVTQTIYAMTLDHIREYGTLKAMGATNGYLYRVIIQQAVISAVIGYAMAMAVSSLVVSGSRQGGAAILMPPSMAVGMFGLTLVMLSLIHI